MATLVHDTLCATLSGLSKIYRACGYRVGWAVFSGRTARRGGLSVGARAAVARCACAATCRRSGRCRPRSAATRAFASWSAPGGRLYESRRAILEAVDSSRFCSWQPPTGRDVCLRRRRSRRRCPDFDDQQFALDLLEQKHVLVAPGVSFNVPVPQSFPRHHAARSGDAADGVRAHRGAARGLCERGTARGGAPARGGRGPGEIQVEP